MNDVPPLIEIQGLSKYFGATQALNNVDLKIESGRIIGLLGLNGSGKTTLLCHMLGLYLADQGSCKVFGHDSGKLEPDHLARIGYVAQKVELINWLTVGQHINYVKAYYPTWNEKLQEKFVSEFDIPLKKRVGALSPGKRQQLAILFATGFEPELLLLDEPAASLDPIARKRFLDMLLEIIQGQDRTIVISSHILSDVEKVIDHTLVLKEGEVIRDLELDSLLSEFCRLRVEASEDLPQELPFRDILECRKSSRQALLTLRKSSLPAAKELAENLNCQYEVEPLPLEAIFEVLHLKAV